MNMMKKCLGVMFAAISLLNPGIILAETSTGWKPEMQERRNTILQEKKEKVKEAATERQEKREKKMTKRASALRVHCVEMNKKLGEIIGRTEQKVETLKTKKGSNSKGLSDVSNMLLKSRETLTTASNNCNTAADTFDAIEPGKWSENLKQVNGANAMLGKARSGFAEVHKQLARALAALARVRKQNLVIPASGDE